MKACFAFLLLSLSEGDDGPRKQNFHRHLQTTLQPVSYSTRNGHKHKSIKLWDDTYSNIPPSYDGDYLFGGVGKLTDGVKAEVDVDTNPDLYVGWKSSVHIKFFFETKSIIDNVKISVDDSGKNGICRPKEVIINSVRYEFPENSVAGPHEADIALTSPVISSSVNIVLIKKCDWIAVSEIEFGQNNHMTQVQPARYNMFNGGEMNGMTFWDDKYSPAPTESYEYLFGGLGQLTDGIKAEESWNVNSSPYVGWEKSNPPHITFFFEDFCFIDEVRISVDDFDSQVCPPKNAIFSDVVYDFPENDGTGPYEAVIELENNKISKEFHLVAENECDWLMISEVEFFARDMDRDGIPDGTDACPHTFEDEIDCGDEGRYIWNGTHWITKDENGEIVPANHYDMKTLRGCSCEQILDILGPCENNDCRRNGCTKEKLDEWMDCEPPTMSPTPMPSNVPSSSSAPSNVPSPLPTIESDFINSLSPSSQYPFPSRTPSSSPSDVPSASPTNAPSDAPADSPSNVPTNSPTNSPTDVLSDSPTGTPSSSPSDVPSASPTNAPSDAPTNSPSSVPTNSPTNSPTDVPSDSPIGTPSSSPSDVPSASPTNVPSDAPTNSPSNVPTKSPTNSPTDVPSDSPSGTPSSSPSDIPSASPTNVPSDAPTNRPSNVPTKSPTNSPTDVPSDSPTGIPSSSPSDVPSASPTNVPSDAPTNSPSKVPTVGPTESPTNVPSDSPTDTPSSFPSDSPTNFPSRIPTDSPTESPTNKPSDFPSITPSGFPSFTPTSSPTAPSPCSDWCYGEHNLDKYNKLDKKTMCQYHFHCSGCPECENVPQPTCDRPSCESDELPWKEKCTKSNCGSCPECENEHSFPVCDEEWCNQNVNPWDEKCNLMRCSDCCQCEERSLLLYCHKELCDQMEDTWEEKCEKRECGACNECVEVFSSPVCKESVCKNNQMTWDEKCDMQDCGACLECSQDGDYVFVFCENDCIDNELSWEDKCNTKNCSGCPQCFDDNSPPVCRKPWCEQRATSWETKCNLQLCGACPKCSLSSVNESDNRSRK